MENIEIPLPGDPEKLKEIIFKMQKQYDSEIHILEEQVKHLYAQLFGPKSEKSSKPSPQMSLFDMPEPGPTEDRSAEPKGDQDTSMVKPHNRRKPGRKPLPAELPRIDEIHDIPEEDKVCGCGCELTKIGEEIAEKLDIIPASIRVIRHIRPKYACRCCEGVEDDGRTVKIAPVPPQIIPKGIASGGLIAHLITAKFDDALPFYRQEKQFKRLGVDLGRNSMCSWAMKVAEQCQPLLELFRENLRTGPLINVDETTVQVLNEPGKKASTKSYMWVFRGGDPSKPSLLFHYSRTRGAVVAREFFEGYSGTVQSDGYKGYDFLDFKPDVNHVGCLAHLRRKFFEADKARGINAGKAGSTTVALGFIKNIYLLEKGFKDKKIHGDALLAVRDEKIRPIWEKFKQWLDKKEGTVPPKGLLGKAITYATNQWHRIVAYVKCPYATPDNNLAENAIRPFVIGRKNWLFAGTPKGAKASATLYSLVETAKANGIDSYSYLRFLFENLPFAKAEDDYRKLLPQNVTKEQLDYKVSWSVV
jgi:transposase